MATKSKGATTYDQGTGESNYSYKGPGLIISIEGLDGTGKATQTGLLINELVSLQMPVGSRTFAEEARWIKEYLSSKDGLVKTMSFPDYDTESGKVITDYKAGRFGDPALVNAYFAGMLFAQNRYEKCPVIREHLSKGGLWVFDRYRESNESFQGQKLETAREREEFFTWIRDLESNKFNLPESDLVLFLDLDPKVGQEQAIKQGRVLDKHESNLELLTRARQVYTELAMTRPYSWKRLDCTDYETGKALPKEKIHEMIGEQVTEFLRRKQSGTELEGQEQEVPFGD